MMEWTEHRSVVVDHQFGGGRRQAIESERVLRMVVVVATSTAQQE
jgi:hypothetical protein